MPRLPHLLLGFTLLTAATLAHANGGSPTPPTAADLGLGIAAAASGKTVPVGRVGQVPEPETWIFTLAGLLAAGLLRRRKR